MSESLVPIVFWLQMWNSTILLMLTMENYTTFWGRISDGNNFVELKELKRIWR